MKQIRSVPKKYSAARLVAWVTQAAGFVLAISGPLIVVLSIVGVAVAGHPIKRETIGAAFILLPWTPLVGIPIIAQGQLMSIAIDVEHNTRAMVKAVRDLPMRG